jgi:hypothetical protein
MVVMDPFPSPTAQELTSPEPIVAQGGYLLPPPSTNSAAGRCFETTVEATEPGVWTFSCLLLNHAEREHGRFRMVTTLMVAKERD